MTYRRNGKIVTEEEFMQSAKGWDYSTTGSFQAGSFQPFISPIDGKEIKNQGQLSAHNREHNVQQVGHEFEKTVINNKMENDYARESRQSGD